MPLPDVSAGGLSGLLEILAARGGQDGLAELADQLNFEIDDLLPLVDAAVMLGLAQVHDARLDSTEAGREFAQADIDASKKLFGELISERAPLIKAILGRYAPPPTGPCARDSSWTCCAGVSPTARPGASSTPPSNGAGTASCSTTTRNAASWSWSAGATVRA